MLSHIPHIEHNMVFSSKIWSSSFLVLLWCFLSGIIREKPGQLILILGLKMTNFSSFWPQQFLSKFQTSLFQPLFSAFHQGHFQKNFSKRISDLEKSSKVLILGPKNSHLTHFGYNKLSYIFVLNCSFMQKIRKK